MNDSEYLFKADSAEKKRVAHSAGKRNRSGKGPVHFPSDYLSSKERKAMSGEVKNFNLAEPMSWAKFKLMPDDLRRQYVQRVKDRFGVPDKMIFGMLGISQSKYTNELRRLGLGKKRGGGHVKCTDSDIQAFSAWVSGAAQEEITEFVVRSGTFKITATPTELSQFVTLLCGSGRKVYTISFEED